MNSAVVLRNSSCTTQQLRYHTTQSPREGGVGAHVHTHAYAHDSSCTTQQLLYHTNMRAAHVPTTIVPESIKVYARIHDNAHTPEQVRARYNACTICLETWGFIYNPTNRTAIGKAVPQPYAHCRNWLQNEIPHLGERRSPTYYKIHSFLNAPLRFQRHMRNGGTVLTRNMKRNTNTQIQMTKAETDRIAKFAHNRGAGAKC